jgi:NitT/TauT family transport system substrate-binding protein
MKRLLALVLIFAAGCKCCTESHQDEKGQLVSAQETPSFSLCYSEYPSWSVFGVADELGLIDAKPGKQGSIEQKYGIDIVLKLADYDTCITWFGSSTVDASCQTNIDSLAPSLGRSSVVILPTSTSVGGDACIVVGVVNKDDKDSILAFLKDNPTYGLEKSVSQYTFERNLTLLNKDVNLQDYSFKNMDPAAASQAMQTKQANVNSIMVWNPFVLQTLRTRQDAKTLFDSSTIPEEIVDCVVVGKDVLSKQGGKQFALAILDAYFTVCNRMKTEGDPVYVALGSKFSNLNAQDMRQVCQQTRFYDTSTKALQLMQSEKFHTQTMPLVVSFCKSHDMLKKTPSIGRNQADSDLNFDDSYLREYQK